MLGYGVVFNDSSCLFSIQTGRIAVPCNGFPNDIALLKLDQPANLSNEYIETVNISENSTDYYTDAECWISGWGATVG